MTKAEFIERVQKAAGLDLSKAAVQTILDTGFDEIVKAVKKDGKFTVPNFGTFKVRKRAARKGRNPRTGEEIKIKASKTVAFSPAPSLKNKV
ncbi:MAG: HU-related DNA-binding protein HupN [Candidatus Sumerlaeia bacterium]